MVDPKRTTSLHCDLWMDFTDPWSYLALNAMRKAVAELPFEGEVEINVRPHFSAAGSPNSDAFRQAVKRGAEEGMNIAHDPFTEPLPPTVGVKAWMATMPAQQLVAFARELDEGSGDTRGADTLQMRVAEGLLRTAFEIGSDIRNPEVVIGVGQDFGIPGSQGLGAIEDVGLEDDVLAQFELGTHLGFDRFPVVSVNDGLHIPGEYTASEFAKALTSAYSFYTRGGEATIGGEESL